MTAVRAAFIKAPWQSEIRVVDLPDRPPPGQVLLSVDACGICGTDLSSARQGAKDWSPVGHEIAGEITALGTGCPSHLCVGQKVVLESSSFCSHCMLCRNGRSALCSQAANFWSGPSLGISEAMLAPACCLVPYQGIDPIEACLAEPIGVAIDLVKTADIGLGDRVCMVGPGPIGLIAAVLAMRAGAIQVVVVGLGRHALRLDFARSLGCEVLATDEPLDRCGALAKAFDHVLVTSPTDTIAPALSLLANGGVLSYLGIGSHDGHISLDAHDFHFRKLQLRASFASPALYLPLALDLMRRGILPGRRLISHVFGLDQVQEAFMACRDAASGALKVVITPGGR